jgi:hypothetical protein
MEDVRVMDANVEEVHEASEIEGYEERHAHGESDELVSQRSSVGQNRNGKEGHRQDARAAKVNLVRKPFRMGDYRCRSCRLDSSHVKQGERCVCCPHRQRGKKGSEHILTICEEHEAHKRRNHDRKAKIEFLGLDHSTLQCLSLRG